MCLYLYVSRLWSDAEAVPRNVSMFPDYGTMSAGLEECLNVNDICLGLCVLFNYLHMYSEMCSMPDEAR